MIIAQHGEAPSEGSKHVPPNCSPGCSGACSTLRLFTTEILNTDAIYQLFCYTKLIATSFIYLFVLLTVIAANVSFCRSSHKGSQRDLFRMWEGCGVWLLYLGHNIVPFPQPHLWAGGVNTSGKITSFWRAVLHDCQHNLTHIIKQTKKQKPLTKQWTLILQNTCPVLNRLSLANMCRCRNTTLEYTRRMESTGKIDNKVLLAQTLPSPNESENLCLN